MLNASMMSSRKLGIGTSITNTMLTAAAGTIQSTVDFIRRFRFCGRGHYALPPAPCCFTCACARYTKAKTSATAV